MKKYSPDAFLVKDEIENGKAILKDGTVLAGQIWAGGCGDSVYEYEDDDNDDPTFYVLTNDGIYIHDKLKYIDHIEDLND